MPLFFYLISQYIPRTHFRVDIGKELMSCDVLSTNENDENYCSYNINNIMLNYATIFGIFIKEIINNHFHMDVL